MHFSGTARLATIHEFPVQGQVWGILYYCQPCLNACAVYHVCVCGLKCVMLDFSFYMMTKHEVRLQQQVVRQVQVCTRLCANFYIFLVQADSSPGICYLWIWSICPMDSIRRKKTNREPPSKQLHQTLPLTWYVVFRPRSKVEHIKYLDPQDNYIFGM